MSSNLACPKFQTPSKHMSTPVPKVKVPHPWAFEQNKNSENRKGTSRRPVRLSDEHYNSRGKVFSQKGG